MPRRRPARQKARRADAVLAEMKVVADRRAADPEPPDEIMVNEILRRGLGAAPCRRSSPRRPQVRSPAKRRSLAASSVRRNRGVCGLKKRRGCGSKVSAPAGRPSAMRARQRRVDDRAVAEMNAVEIAHGDHRRRGSGRTAAIADHGKVIDRRFQNHCDWRADRDLGRWTKSSGGLLGFAACPLAVGAGSVNGLFNMADASYLG